MSSVRSPSSDVRNRVQAALGRWRGALDDGDRPLFEQFVAHALDRLRGPYLALHHPTQVLRHLEMAFSFSLMRQPDEIKLDVKSGESKGVVAMSTMPDQPFIVDTVRLFFRRHDADYWGGFNVIVNTLRDDAGKLTAFDVDSGTAESIVLLEADAGELTVDLAGATEKLTENLQLARSMVSDFRAMTRCVERAVEKFEVSADREPEQAAGWRESADFLRWLLLENFVFMGVELVRDGAVEDAMGIQRTKGSYYNDNTGDWPAPHAPATIQVRKGTLESPVHRSGRIDEIQIRLPAQWDDQVVFVRGMFTYRAVTQPSRNVPILRRILSKILGQSDSKPGSFRYKGIANVFDSLPTEFLFTASEEAIVQMVDLVFESEQQQEVGVTFLELSPQSAFCLVAMPKGEFSDELRRAIQSEIVGSISATYSDHGLFVGRYDTVLLHYYLTGVENLSADLLHGLSERIRALATPWLARLWQALAERFDESTADRLADRWGKAFPDEWIRSTSATRAVQDILVLENLNESQQPAADLYLDGDELVLRLYEPVDIYLTDILPVLNDFGLVVIDSYPTDVKPKGTVIGLDTFRLGDLDGVDRDTFLSRKRLLIDALEAVFADQVQADALDALVIRAGLSWREVDLVRGYLRYMRQLQVKVGPTRVREILLNKPDLVGHLVAFFRAKFNPDLQVDRDKAMAAAWETVDEHLRQIRAHDEDLVFGTLAQLFQVTLRTNFWREDKPFHYLSFKIDVRKSRSHTDAAHLYEIFVHNKDVEGVHVRFGPVARGGLRWSDRDDFRTEVLGLATTQQKKNVVIVPEGSKGGFYLHNPSNDRTERRAEADRHYKTFIRGLLDITDNAVGGVPTRPPRVVCHDGMDPYLVVAADKGTAHLSDTANGISLSYGFWLGDAFASGGSNGYDHKAVGITARGAWVLVRRHFAEMGRDPYAEDFTCAGVGDLGGDVFGNGMVETPHGRLLAAFNHLHIFLDPQPDTAKAFAERDRLFKIGGREAGWNGYNKAIISDGGGIFDRSAKTIPLSEQVQEMLGLAKSEAAPNEVIRHILKMKVDLLWNGGIGTYVKASFESHADADDRSNDELRVNASELGCAVVGEGGNLGFTQQARIEAGLNGVRLNTDAIDNSAGVDMSDHEVNLKILLARMVDDGRLDEAARNTLLHSLTDEVADLVLANNNAHGRQMSRDAFRARLDPFQFGHAISFVERTSGMRREQLDLPSQRELVERAAANEGLTRPELAVLGAYVKMYVYRELMAGDPKEIPGYDRLLMEYFPKAIQEAYPDDIKNHMLANEIAMTVATTEVIADGGAALVPIMIETTGASVPDIVTAFLKAQRLARMADARSTLEQLRTTVSLNTLSESFVRIVEGARMASLYWLSARGRVPTDEEIERMLPAVDRYGELQATEAFRETRATVATLLQDDIPEHVADLIVSARFLNLGVMAWAVSKNTGANERDSIIKLQAIGRGSGLLPIIEDLAVRPAHGSWEPIALRILFVRFLQLLRQLMETVTIAEPVESVDQLQPLLESGVLKAVRDQVDDLLNADDERPSPATLLVLEERVAAAMARLA